MSYFTDSLYSLIAEVPSVQNAIDSITSQGAQSFASLQKAAVNTISGYAESEFTNEKIAKKICKFFNGDCEIGDPNSFAVDFPKKYPTCKTLIDFTNIDLSSLFKETVGPFDGIDLNDPAQQYYVIGTLIALLVAAGGYYLWPKSNSATDNPEAATEQFPTKDQLKAYYDRVKPIAREYLQDNKISFTEQSLHNKVMSICSYCIHNMNLYDYITGLSDEDMKQILKNVHLDQNSDNILLNIYNSDDVDKFEKIQQQYKKFTDPNYMSKYSVSYKIELKDKKPKQTSYLQSFKNYVSSAKEVDYDSGYETDEEDKPFGYIKPTF